MPNKAKVFVILVILLGAGTVALAAAGLSSVDSPERMAAYIALTALASMVKLRLPGLQGTYSLNAILLLAGAVYLTLPETVMAAVAGALVQSVVRAERRPTSIQLMFNVANETFSIGAASLCLSYLVREGIWPFRPALLASAAAMYFVLNTGLVSGVLTLLGGGAYRDVNRQWYSQSFTYYLMGAAAVGLLPVDGRPVDIEACTILIPLVYLSHFFCGLARDRAEAATVGNEDSSAIPASARTFTGTLAASAISLIAFAALRMEPVDWPWLLSYLALAVVTATWKVRLPGTTGTISVHYVVVLAALAQSSMIGALMIAAVGPLVQSLWKTSTRPKPVQVVFNIAAMVVATGVTYWICRILAEPALRDSLVAFFTCAAAIQFAANTGLVAIVLSLVEGEGVFPLWRRVYFWAFPIYMVGAAAAALMAATTRAAGWVPSLLILPLMAMTQLTYRIQVSNRATPAERAS